MKLDCKNCGAMCGHWLVVEVQDQESSPTPHYKCICQKCGAIWLVDHNPLKGEAQASSSPGPEAAEAFGVQAPPNHYYLHRGHTWAELEESGEVRVGLDDFSQKLLGPVEELRLPPVGAAFYQDHICLAVVRKDQKASFEAPVDGIITEINPKVCARPSLINDDPYGEGWLFKVRPTNLKHNLDNLISGDQNAAWVGKETHRLLNLLDTAVGVTLPSGGALVDDVYGHYPKLGWRRLVKEFFLTNVTRSWKKRS